MALSSFAEIAGAPPMLARGSMRACAAAMSVGISVRMLCWYMCTL